MPAVKCAVTCRSVWCEMNKQCTFYMPSSTIDGSACDSLYSACDSLYSACCTLLLVHMIVGALSALAC